MTIRIAIIGAGSAQFSLGIIRDIALTDGLKGSSVALMDSDPQRLDVVYRLAKRYVEELDVDIRFEKTSVRKAALTDAQFVINTALAGGHDQMEEERDLLQRYGYYRGINLHAPHRQLDLMVSIARDIQEICPDAYLLQSSNPLPEGCSLMIRETGVKAIGLCHGHFDYHLLVKTLGLELQHVGYEATGFNHCIWMTHFSYKGEDAYPLIDAWIQEESEYFWRNWKPSFTEIQMSPAAIHLYKFYGLMPIGDTCRASWPGGWWYHTDCETKKRWWGLLGGFDGEEGWAQHLAALTERVNMLTRLAYDMSQPITESFPPEKSIEQIVPIIDALHNDSEATFQVNTPNNGAFQDLPDDIVVEIPVVINRQGIHRFPLRPLPHQIMLGVIFPRWIFAERLITAYSSRDKRYLMQTYLDDQRTRSWEQASDALNGLFALPGSAAMRQHYSTNGVVAQNLPAVQRELIVRSPLIALSLSGEDK